MALTFDGPNKLIIFDATQTDYTDVEIYSRWKEWVAASDNAKYLPAFSGSVGGEDAGGGQTTPTFIFVRNDLGWRIKKPEANIDVEITGNLLPGDPLQAFLVNPTGAFTPGFTIIRSNVSNLDLSPLLASIETTKSHARAADVQTQPL